MKNKLLSFLLALILLIPGMAWAGPPVIYGTALGSAGTGFDVGTVGVEDKYCEDKADREKKF